MQRRDWKENLLARIEARLHAPPMALPSITNWPRMTRNSYEYRRVYATGQFDHAKAQFWHSPPVNGQKGAQIITPFMLTSGGVVLVNRGFVPDGGRDAIRQEAGVQNISGLLRWPAKRRIFDPPDEPHHNFWFVRDIDAMAANMGVQAAGFFINADKSTAAGFPLGGQTRRHFPNRHLEYALTWYGLALIFVVIFILWHIRPPDAGQNKG